LDRRALRVARMDRRERVHAERAEINTIARAHNRLRCNLPGEAETRQPFAMVCAVRTAAATHEGQSTGYPEGRYRNFRYWIFGVIRDRLRLNRVRRIAGESRHQPVVLFRDRPLHFVA